DRDCRVERQAVAGCDQEVRCPARQARRRPEIRRLPESQQPGAQSAQGRAVANEEAIPQGQGHGGGARDRRKVWDNDQVKRKCKGCRSYSAFVNDKFIIAFAWLVRMS